MAVALPNTPTSALTPLSSTNSEPSVRSPEYILQALVYCPSVTGAARLASVDISHWRPSPPVVDSPLLRWRSLSLSLVANDSPVERHVVGRLRWDTSDWTPTDSASSNDIPCGTDTATYAFELFHRAANDLRYLHEFTARSPTISESSSSANPSSPGSESSNSPLDPELMSYIDNELDFWYKFFEPESAAATATIQMVETRPPVWWDVATRTQSPATMSFDRRRSGSYSYNASRTPFGLHFNMPVSNDSCRGSHVVSGVSTDSLLPRLRSLSFDVSSSRRESFASSAVSPGALSPERMTPNSRTLTRASSRSVDDPFDWLEDVLLATLNGEASSRDRGATSADNQLSSPVFRSFGSRSSTSDSRL